MHQSIRHADLEDRHTSDPLEETLWQGRQWAVTAGGVEARDGTYFISKDLLLENATEHYWMQHMSSKDWVDLPDFSTALCVALTLLGPDRNELWAAYEGALGEPTHSGASPTV